MQTGPRRERLTSVDALRGLVMVLMPLDHVRDFFHASAMFQSPTDLATTTPAVFLTRWITHFCAPVFLFTAGLGAYLRLARGTDSSRLDLAKFLVSRGLWLILLELTVMRFAFDFRLTGTMPIFLITLWALGGSMILLAPLVALPVPLLAVLSAAVICLHNLADGIQARSWGNWAWVWNVLHQPGAVMVGTRPMIFGYPLLPLAATMAVGYCAGVLFERPPEWRRRVLLWMGTAMGVGFVLIRWVNVYGDAVRWKHQPSAAMTAVSFLNVSKYPASLDFLLMTLGPALILLALFEKVRMRDRNPLLVFGRVPLFFFVVHFVVAHFILVAGNVIRYGWQPFVLRAPPSMGNPASLFPAHFGYSLGAVYAVWLVVLAVMYPLCLWFMRLKRNRREWWMSYL